MRRRSKAFKSKIESKNFIFEKVDGRQSAQANDVPSQVDGSNDISIFDSSVMTTDEDLDRLGLDFYW